MVRKREFVAGFDRENDAFDYKRRNGPHSFEIKTTEGIMISKELLNEQSIQHGYHHQSPVPVRVFALTETRMNISLPWKY
jgi:hypothetical protein